MNTLFEKQVADLQTGEITTTLTIKKRQKTKDQFIQTYFNDIGVLFRCTKGQIDFLIACMKLKYVEWDTNELVLNIPRKKELAELAGIKTGSIANFQVALKRKGIIVEDHNSRLFLNPKMFFYGGEIEREKMFRLSIDYTICEDC